MFDRLGARAARRAAARAADRRAQLAERIGGAAPAGVTVAVEGEAVVLSGRGLVRRFTTEPALRWLVREARDERR